LNSVLETDSLNVGNKHCVITKEAPDADASLKDFSTNGTFVRFLDLYLLYSTLTII